MKCSEGLSNRVFISIRIYTDHMKFAAYMAVSLITFFLILLVLFYMIVYTVVCFVCFCLILYMTYSYCYIYVLLLLCLWILIVMYDPFWVFCFIFLFRVLFVCKCVLYYCHRVSNQLQLTNISHHMTQSEAYNVGVQQLVTFQYRPFIQLLLWRDARVLHAQESNSGKFVFNLSENTTVPRQQAQAFSFASDATITADFQVYRDIQGAPGSQLPHFVMEPQIITNEKLNYV